MTPDIRPDKHNWKQFCQESLLADEERAAWEQLARAIREAEATGSTELFDFVFEATEAERKELRRNELASRTADWSDLVAYADAARRLKRAELAAWARWKERAAIAGARGERGDKL